jgi:tetrahydromethanopterin S-methyltransferase subunit G
MNWWKRNFGLDPIDLAVHATVTGLAAGVMGEASGNDALILLTLAIGTALYAWRRQRALRALPGEPLGDYERARMEDLEARVAELEEAQVRLMELEERMDFTERVLARPVEGDRLPAVKPEAAREITPTGGTR